LNDSPESRVLVESTGAIAKIRLNRPDKLNALTTAMLVELREAIELLGKGGESEGIILCGSGRAFSAGKDLTDMEEPGDTPPSLPVERFHDLTRAILGTEVPVAAAIEGIVVGGASEMTMCCDTRVGTEAAEYFLPENSRGIVISNASSYILPRLVGGANALSIVLGSKRLGAAEALKVGLLDVIVDPGEAEAAAEETLLDWGAGVTTREHLRLMRPSLEEVEKAMARETESSSAVRASGATVSGIAAFLGRDQPA